MSLSPKRYNNQEDKQISSSDHKYNEGPQLKAEWIQAIGIHGQLKWSESLLAIHPIGKQQMNSYKAGGVQDR